MLFILVDDLGYQDLGFMGSQYYETPHIDQLAKKGFIFTNAYSNSRVCSPSRASILTGQFTARTGVTDWIGAKTGAHWREKNRYDRLLPPSYTDHLPHTDLVLPEVLKEAGYKTFFAGKWHLGGKGSAPEDHGFDINIGGYQSGSPRGGYFAPYKNPKLNDGQPGENLSLRLAKETADFITANKEDAFFAYLSFYAVHGPIQTTQERWKKYQAKALEMGVPDSGFDLEKNLPFRKTQDNPIYAGLIASMDKAVGHVLATLEQQGLMDNTVVIFTSDNGGVVSGDAYSTAIAPLRGGKGYQWEGGTRVPLIIYDPNNDRPDKRIETPAIGSDLFPTILDLTGIPLKPEAHKDGQTLQPLLSGATIPSRSLIWHYPHYGNQGGDPSSVIRKGKWKLIHYYETGGNELYNIEADEGEEKNLVEDFPAVEEELARELKSFLASNKAKTPVPDPEYDQNISAKKKAKRRNKLLITLEQQRKAMLSENFMPNKNWWGSKTTIK